MDPKRKRRLYNAVGVLLSILFIYFCIRSIGREEIGKVFSLPHPWYLIAAVILNFVVMGFRTQIWRILLNPIRRLPFWTLFDVLHVGYMANNLLPLKAGDFFRASFVAKKWDAPYAQILTTVGLERYFAGFSLILLFFALAYMLEVPLWMKSGIYILGAILITIQIALMIIWKNKPDLERWEKRHPLLYRIIEFFSHISEGSQPLRSGKSFLILVFYALWAWFAQLAMLKIIESAYGLNIDWAATLFVIVAINVAIALPSAPGNLGTFEFATILGYAFIGIDRPTALGIGIFFHFLQVIPITLIGLIYYFRWGLRLKDMEHMAERLA